ncbi:hypothetical protein SteCoe_8060 [Stentor coeruleus]|uniref:Uncharacterized protein n=1 Tax=Stentor coeruleus TaxID=5963 RepID=A0A1R2CL56_9CILI|nr:hypothetical protein SteCoe_8060 [Stentor coeruleus]
MWIISYEEALKKVVRIFGLMLLKIWVDIKRVKPRKKLIESMWKVYNWLEKKDYKLKTMSIIKWTVWVKGRITIEKQQKSSIKSYNWDLYKYQNIKTLKPKNIEMVFYIKTLADFLHKKILLRLSSSFLTIKTLHYTHSPGIIKNIYPDLKKAHFLQRKYDSFIYKIRGILDLRLIIISSFIYTNRYAKMFNVIQKNTKNTIKNYIEYWKFIARQKKISKPFLTLTSFCEIISRKTFPYFWHAWKCLKNVDMARQKVRQKMMMRKCIDNWQKNTILRSDKWIEGFYVWRSCLRVERMRKLKDYKIIFS